ncbi:MAG: efflux RND transporter periplasmic adaptor subunit [Caulobacter sp.]|nr:efflux RND transporter periplasmic adaptor subunit [Caulobacter sp.]
MIRRHFFLIAAAAILTLMVIIGGVRLATADATPGGKAGGGQRAAQVSQVVVGEQPFADRISVLGVAKGRQSVTITSDTAELVTGVLFRDGQAVSRGQVLVTLKATEQDAAVAEAEARESQARRDYERWKTLAEKGVAPRATAEQYLASLQSAEAATAAARARKLDRVIRAPFSGVVGLSDIAPGALISPGSPIVSLDDLSMVRVDFEVPDRYLAVLRTGSTIVAAPDAYPDESFSGRIAQIDTRVDTTTRAVTARAEFPNPGGRLRPGMLMRVSIEHGQRQALAAPEAAIQYEGEKAFVFVIIDRDGKQVARKTEVTPGLSEGGRVEIVEGLKAGDRLVADGLNRLQDGQPVQTGAGRAQGPKGAKGAR